MALTGVDLPERVGHVDHTHPARVDPRRREGLLGHLALVTLTTDMNLDASFALVFEASRVADGPVCTLRLPERISSGTHSTWVSGSELRRWDTADTAAQAVGL